MADTSNCNGGQEQVRTATADTDAAGDYQRQRREDGRLCSLAAHEYLRMGWSVLCLCPPDHVGVGKEHGKKCDSPGKVPLGSWKQYQDRLPTEQEVRSRWQGNPTGNVGIALGPVSGLVRIDVDEQAAEEDLARRSGGDVPDTLEFVSGSGSGRGLLYAIPPGAELKTTTHKHGGNGELRLQARGAETVLPPSRHASGRKYEWKPGHSPKDIAAAPMPDWLVRELTPTQAEAPSGHASANGKPVLEDDALLANARAARNGHKFSQLWGGDTSAHQNDHSAADLALCHHLAFWTGCNAEQMDRLFRRSQLLRPKWDEVHYANGELYGAHTIAKAIEGCTQTYRGRGADGPPPDEEPPDQQAEAEQEPKAEAQAQDYGRSPKRETPFARNDFPPPVPISELPSTEIEQAWLWRGYLLPGECTMLSGLWKSGKTSLISHLLKATGDGSRYFLGQRLQQFGAVVVSEEPRHRWAKRRDDLGIRDNVLMQLRPFKARPDLKTWRAYLEELAAHVRGQGLSLAVIDPISNFWPVEDENNSVQVLNALEPLRAVTETGAALLLLHHPRKSGGVDGVASRGSGAFPQWTDCNMELHYYTAGDHHDRRRVIRTKGRDDATPAELVIELLENHSGYKAYGDRHDAATRERNDLITQTLPQWPPGMTADELLAAWPGEKKPAKRTLELALADGVEHNLWTCTGQGVRNDPRRYYVKE
jgi:hypothetical protein